MHAFDQSVELTAAPVSVEKGAGGILWGEDTNRGDKLFNLMVEPGVWNGNKTTTVEIMCFPQ